MLKGTFDDREIYIALAQMYSRVKDWPQAETSINKALMLSTKQRETHPTSGRTIPHVAYRFRWVLTGPSVATKGRRSSSSCHLHRTLVPDSHLLGRHRWDTISEPKHPPGVVSSPCGERKPEDRRAWSKIAGLTSLFQSPTKRMST